MIVFDLVNDETPLFIESTKVLISNKSLALNMVLGVTEGNRWKKEGTALNTVNRLDFFKDLDIQNIHLEQELNRISNEYDNFNIYACDRYLIQKDKEYQKKMLVYSYLFFEDLFAKDVTHYFTTGIAYAYNLISYQVSIRFKVKHISFYGIRIGNKTAVSYDVTNTFNEVYDMYKGFSFDKVTKAMYDPIKAFANKPTQPSYMKNAINASTIKRVFIKEFFIRFNKFYLKKRYKYDLFTRNPFELSTFKLKKIFNAQKINFSHNSIFEEVDYTDNYFVFPLHMQPEASTLILAPFHVDQKTSIINISKVLPPNTKLYVKEHKSALGQHSKAFYEELKSYPNVKLISYKENMFELIKASMGTINLSSTVGFESLMLKKPSIVFGNVFYNDSGLTFRVNSYSELKEIIKMVNNKEFSVTDYFNEYEARLAYYIFCLYTKSYPFEFNVAKLDTKKRVLLPDNIHGMSECIRKQIQS